MDNNVQLKTSIVEEFKFEYDDSYLTEDQIINLLGYDNESVPEPIVDSIRSILEILPTKVDYKSGFKVFNPRKVSVDKECFVIDNRKFDSGKIINVNLKDSETIGFLVATIGSAIGDWYQSLMSQNEILNGYLVDKIASELVEMIGDKTETKLKEILQPLELKTTNRYSPGYCGWNVSDQQKLFSLLPQNFCDVSLNKNSMMLPIKSISAVIGIGKNVEKKNY
ncbi:MAG TPA: vitamin B12 dependent-methionine synthase activation domain-containing protein [Ignavibacteriaceae bacterium]|nr:vitamin B12 dependent-methionine synthase activation domain-containing protein [Ignavibacteriaceae bacterium]